MNKRNTVIAAIIAIAALAAVPLLNAAPGGHRGPGGHGPGPGLFGRHMQEELNLSEAQVDQIRGIFAELHTQNEPYREQVRGGFEAVIRTLLDNPNNLSAAQALLDQQSAAERAMKANRLAATAKALNVLTPDQRAQLGDMLDDRAEHRQGRGRKGSKR